ncbi:MAG: 3-hydroxyacyl-CoA dehydrogenase family protein [Tissierellia bacterium]|nr:3-hydroxyacyl-CoA dehydrogenase family protein [Tissierellia bacterium]
MLKGRNREICKIAVLGAGVMGPGIAQSFAMGGREVAIWTRSAETKHKAQERIIDGLNIFVDENVIETSQIDQIYRRISFKNTIEEAVHDCDMILETIVENVEAKKELYDLLEKIVPGDVIIASNTSALNIFELVPKKLLAQMFIAHWYGPAQLIPLVEVVKSEEAPQEMADAIVNLLYECNKTPVLMKKFIQGYIINRLLQCINREIFFLIDNGYCTAQDIDNASKASFIPRAMVLGLLQKIDFGGLDMTANNYYNKSYRLPEEVDIPRILKEKLDTGELGIKSGKGFYDYRDKNINDLLKKRDKQLFEVFKLSKKLENDPL